MTSIDMQTLRTRKWHLNITKHLMERHFAEPGGQLGTGGNSNTVGPLGIPCQRDLKNRSMATCDTFLWSPLLKGTICPDFFPATWPKKSWLLKKSFAADFFWSEFRKKNVIKKVETETRWDMYLIMYVFPLQKQQGRRVTAFFWYAFWKSQAQNETIWAWDFVKTFIECDANRWFGGEPTKGCVKGSAGLCKGGRGGVHCATRCRCGRELSPGGCSWCEIFTNFSSGHPSPSWSSWRRALVPAWSDCLGLRTLELTLIHESVLRSSSVVVGTIEAT